MKKRIIILGSTGSIGKATLEVVEALGDEVYVVGLSAQRNWEALAEQAARYRVPRVAIQDEALAQRLQGRCGGSCCVLSGEDALTKLIRDGEADLVLSAIVGAAGLPATLAAVERGLDVGLANKESLVVAGSLIMPLARERGSTLLPVDSEHSAIFQAMQSGRREDVRKVYLTASGGPFRTWTRARIASATLEDALNHPTWDMGPKITIDSATMMNKALEIVEAHHLFSLAPEQIDVLIHPESIVHSMVEFRDGSVIAQLGTPDMKTPIQYALTYPRRLDGLSRSLDWDKISALHFETPDVERFPALALGYEAARRGGTCGAVLNAANEAAVERFRAGELPFHRIVEVTRGALERHTVTENPSLDALIEADREARQEVHACIQC